MDGRYRIRENLEPRDMDSQVTTETKAADSRSSADSKLGGRMTWALMVWAAVAVGMVVLVLPRGQDTRGSVDPTDAQVTVSGLTNLGNLDMQERASDPAAVDRALDFFMRGYILDPGHLHARFGLAWARQVKGLPETEWRGLYQETAADASRLVYLSLYNLAYAEQVAQRNPAAIALLEQALRVLPDRADGWLELGAIRLALDGHARAVLDLGRATELDPESARAYHLLGRAHAGLGQHTQAEAAWSRALQLNPGLKRQIEAARSR